MTVSLDGQSFPVGQKVYLARVGSQESQKGFPVPPDKKTDNEMPRAMDQESRRKEIERLERHRQKADAADALWKERAKQK